MKQKEKGRGNLEQCRAAGGVAGLGRTWPGLAGPHEDGPTGEESESNSARETEVETLTDGCLLVTLKQPERSSLALMTVNKWI